MKFWIRNSKCDKVFFDTLEDITRHARKNCKNNGSGYSVYDENGQYVCYMRKRNNEFRVIYPIKK